MLETGVLLIIIGCAIRGVFRGHTNKDVEPRKWCR